MSSIDQLDSSNNDFDLPLTEDDQQLHHVSGFINSDTSTLDTNGGDESVDRNAADKVALDARNAVQIYEEQRPDLTLRTTGGREIGEDAIWSVSSFRPDWGVEKLRDNNPLTYWQSDCPQPHFPHSVNILFHRATIIKQVSIFVDFNQDESYTPKQISIRGGTTFRDLQEITVLDCDDQTGWKNADLCVDDGEPVRVFRLQIAVLSTHQGGRDTHIRQIKLYSPIPAFIHEQDVIDPAHSRRKALQKI
ncbi:anaphase-promoting complex, subunit 10-domain-containing protein [Umbelopsis sp. PMI_123]|nr:anaphase-promoting complex, subunit 10-domain-containing protein [Umbelopsis sp. PMI_123]